MLDNKLVQIALVVLAFYVILQIMNNHVSQEHLDTVVSVPPSGQAAVSIAAPGAETLVQVSAPPALSALSNTVPQPSNGLTTPELAATSSAASAIPVVTSSPSAALTNNIPAPMTAVEEDLVAAAPQSLPEDLAMGKQNANIFAPEPTDLDAMFGKRGFVEPSDLIPKVSQDAELYGGFVPDPKNSQNFLTNRWSLGIDVSKPKKGFVNDLRGIPFPPKLSSLGPFGEVTQFPDLYRKGLGDIT